MDKTFKEFLQRNLSWEDYEHLNDHLGESAKGTTMLLENPRKGKKLQLEKIIELLQKWNNSFDENFLTEHFLFGIPEEENSNA